MVQRMVCHVTLFVYVTEDGMKNITEIQLAIQQRLEQQLREVYQLDAQIQSAQLEASDSLESLETTLIEEVKVRSLKLTRHLARSEHNTKELIRLELEQEQLQHSNASQQYKISTLQNAVSAARSTPSLFGRHHKFSRGRVNYTADAI